MLNYPFTYYATRNTRKRQRAGTIRGIVYAVILAAVYVAAITKLFPNW